MGTLGKAIYTVGFWIRETGQALDRLGCRLQGNYYFQEQRKEQWICHSVFPPTSALGDPPWIDILNAYIPPIFLPQQTVFLSL